STALSSQHCWVHHIELEVMQSSSPWLVGVIECPVDKTNWKQQPGSVRNMKMRLHGSKQIDGAPALRARELMHGLDVENEVRERGQLRWREGRSAPFQLVRHFA